MYRNSNNNNVSKLLSGIATGMNQYICSPVTGGSQARAAGAGRSSHDATQSLIDRLMLFQDTSMYADSWYILIDQYGVRSAGVASRADQVQGRDLALSAAQCLYTAVARHRCLATVALSYVHWTRLFITWLMKPNKYSYYTSYYY